METQVASAKVGVASVDDRSRAESAAELIESGVDGITGSPWRMCAARLAVLVILLGVAAVVYLSPLFRVMFGLRRRERRAADRRLLLTGTFYNVGWFRSHIAPLSLCDRLDQVYVVADEPLFPVAKVTYCVPPGWLSRLVGRTPSRMLWVLLTALRRRPGFVMGYHIMPNALTCLAVAKLLGAKAVYQMTGGPVQIIGGGVGSENVLLRQLGKPSRLREALMYHLVRRFERLVVRGREAVEFVKREHLGVRCTVIPGSVDPDRFAVSAGARDYDVIYVGRLAPAKGCDLLVDVLVEIVRARPSTRVAVVGDGPLLSEMAAAVRDGGVAEWIEFLGRRDDVPELLARSKTFVLTSPSEGLSIAMLEAMTAGLPVVVSDVGELSDVVTDGGNGFLIGSGDSGDYVAALQRLLDDPARWARCSRNAAAAARAYVSPQAVAKLWEDVLR